MPGGVGERFRHFLTTQRVECRSVIFPAFLGRLFRKEVSDYISEDCDHLFLSFAGFFLDLDSEWLPVRLAATGLNSEMFLLLVCCVQ